MTTQKHLQDPHAKREAEKYSRPVPSREFILQHIKDASTHSASLDQLIEHFNLTDDFEREAFRRRLSAMVRDGQLVKNRTGKYRLIKASEVIRGHVIGHREGFGFVAPEDNTSHIFLPAHEMRKVFDGDVVNVRITDVDRRNRREGIITEVIERKRRFIVGQFLIEGRIGFVEPDNQKITQSIIIPLEDRMNAQPGQIVSAEIVNAPTMKNRAIGRIVEILGDYLAPGLEIEVALRSFDLPHEWDENVRRELAKLPLTITNDIIQERIDLRTLPLVTIDSETAKDFDDAVYCEKSGHGWKLYVAIADVSHYIQPNTALDDSAKERGTSVYFPHQVIPMLPELLSNELCSLTPNTDRLCVVCEMNIDRLGEVTRYKFYRAAMHSHARLTYNQVFAMLNQKQRDLQQQFRNILPHLFNLQQLYQALLHNRQARGAIDFDTRELELMLDIERKIEKLVPVKRNEAHRIIEECMLRANVCAAKFLSKHKLLALYRIHDGPKIEKIQQLRDYLKGLKLTLEGDDLPETKDYANLLAQIADRPDAHVIQMLLLRSLSQAFYAPINDGHFGLAFEEYAHFTSPIRRYPDLVVHRAISNFLCHPVKTKTSPKKEQEAFAAMQKLGEHCSMTERRADEATREVLKWLKCEYMIDRIGEEFSGVISGVSSFGLFVELGDTYVEGLAHISTLGDDHYIFDQAQHCLIGKRTKKTYRIGDAVTAVITKIDLHSRQIDLLLTAKNKKRK